MLPRRAKVFHYALLYRWNIIKTKREKRIYLFITRFLPLLHIINMINMKKNKEPDYFLPVITIGGLFVLTLLLLAATMDVPNTKSVGPKVYTGRTHALAIDQAVGGSVKVLSVALTQPSFIVVQKMNSMFPGNIIGVVPLFQKGLYSSRYVPITEKVSEGDRLHIMIYKDNGDGVFTAPGEDVTNADIEDGISSYIYVL